MNGSQRKPLKKRNQQVSSVRGINKHSKEKKLSFEKEQLRWASNELVADWRAERLKCDRIADLCCGIGFQAMSFAKKCNKVYAVELDPEKMENAGANAKKLNFKNIIFIEGNVLDEKIIMQLGDSQVVFCDPERLESENERKVESIRPDVNALLDGYGKITDKIAIEFPPQIKSVPFDCEREYASINGKLNRLTLYFGGLKTCESSAVALPQKAVLKKKPGAKLLRAEAPQLYIYEADQAVQKAGLLPELCEETGAGLVHERKQAFLTHSKLIRSHFFKATYRALATCAFKREEIIASLRSAGAGRVLIRYEVDPKDYWRERTGYEHELGGKKDVVLFNFEGTAVIAEVFRNI